MVALSEEIQPIGTSMGNKTVPYQDEGELVLFDSENINLTGISTTSMTMNFAQLLELPYSTLTVSFFFSIPSGQDQLVSTQHPFTALPVFRWNWMIFMPSTRTSMMQPRQRLGQVGVGGLE